MEIDDLYCKIYLDYDYEKEDLENLFLKISFINGEGSDFHSNNLKIYIVKNHDYYHKKDKTDDFLFYKYLLEIDPLEEVFQEEYLSDLIKLLTFFKSNNIKFVPSCDYEELFFVN